LLRSKQIARCSALLLAFPGVFLPTASFSAKQGAAPADPATALRDALVAACKQDSLDFARVLTVRNAEAFQNLTSAARTTLLKRFVLLDKPGKPGTQTDNAGNLIVYCATRDVTTQMSIGKPELRDNLAYLPFTVKDATDATDNNLHSLTMGMVREAGQWKLLSLGLLLLDLPSLGEEWDRAEIKANEEGAVSSLRALAEAIETYRKTYTRLPESLAALGSAPAGSPKGDNAGLIEPQLAAGRKDGYAFRYVVVGASASGAPAKYELAAIPTEYGRTGTRSFFWDSSGVLHGADRQGSVGSAVDPKLDSSSSPNP
jgi:hypothetical protein